MEIEIPSGAKNSELQEWSYTIPKGYTAEIKDGKVTVKFIKSEDERIRNVLLQGFISMLKYEPVETFFGEPIKDIIAYFERQKESGIRWYKSDNRNNPKKPYIDKAGVFYTTDGRMCYASEIEKQKKQTEELSTRLNGLMQKYVKSGKDEEEQEHRLKCYHLFWDALSDSEFFKQKEQKSLLPEDKVKHSLYVEGFEAGKEVGRQCEKVFGKQKEDKPVWNEEDKKIVETICKEGDLKPSEKRWLKSLPERFNFQPQQEWSKEDTERYLSCLQRLGTGNSDQPETINSKWFKEHCYPQPKPEWSEEDEEMRNRCISSIEEAKDNRYYYKETDGDTSYDEEIAWLKSLRPQPKQEWSKIDEQISNGLIKALENLSSDWLKLHGVIKSDTIAWLKCHHNHLSWKPSEEQMRVFFKATPVNLMPEELAIYQSLYDDLKKLM